MVGAVVGALVGASNCECRLLLSTVESARLLGGDELDEELFPDRNWWALEHKISDGGLWGCRALVL